MSRRLTSSVVADGGTDQLLVPIIQWAIHRLDPDVEILEPEFSKPAALHWFRNSLERHHPYRSVIGA